jgi:hypothetical protein
LTAETHEQEEPVTTIIKLRRGTAAQWTAVNPVLAQGEPALELDTGKEKRGDGVTAWNDLPYLVTGSGGGGGGGAAGAPREDVSKTTASLADQASETGVITMATGYRISKIVTSVPARVRLYATAAKRDADATRAIGDDPTGDHGLMLEYITATGLLSAALSPMVDGYSLEATPSEDIPYTITNLSGGNSPVTVTLTWQKTE